MIMIVQSKKKDKYKICKVNAWKISTNFENMQFKKKRKKKKKEKKREL